MSPFWIQVNTAFGREIKLYFSPFWKCRRFGFVAFLDLSPFWRVAVLDVSPFWLSPFWKCRRFGCRRFGCVAVLVVAVFDVSPFWLIQGKLILLCTVY